MEDEVGSRSTKSVVEASSHDQPNIRFFKYSKPSQDIKMKD